MPTYYNEIDSYAAQWLRNLIAAGHIAPGDVDERDIQDVRPDDLRGYTQCHFFAGIGVWSLALRRAGWADDRPVWTGSCPCQPFSAAGKGLAFDDERHLWPSWFHLIKECKPAVILGEQVASKDADPWIDLVQADMEALDYGFGAVPFPSASVGAPHIRDRLYWVANATGYGRQRGGASEARHGRDAARIESQRLLDACGLAHADHARSQGRRGVPERAAERAIGPSRMAVGLADAMPAGRPERRSVAGNGSAARLCATGGVGNADSEFQRGNGRSERSPTCGAESEMGGQDRQRHGLVDDRTGSPECAAGPTNGFWGDADWLLCRDGKWRPVEPSTFPLAHGAPSRVGRLRAYGNAINAIQAQIWCEVVMDCMPDVCRAVTATGDQNV